MEQVGWRTSTRSASWSAFPVQLPSDPIVHNRVFGIARFDLSTRQFDFTPIGPSPAGMTGLHVAPGKKDAYTVITNGTLGNKRCEFWHFDLERTGSCRLWKFRAGRDSASVCPGMERSCTFTGPALRSKCR